MRLARGNPKVNQQIDLLCTIQGIGEKSAILLLPRLFIMSPVLSDCRKLLSYAGFVPEEKQSGKFKGRVKMSKKGNAWMRRALYMPTLNATQHNPVIKILYERMLAAGQPKRKAVISCMPRLLRLIWGVFRHQEPFDVKKWGGTVDK